MSSKQKQDSIKTAKNKLQNKLNSLKIKKKETPKIKECEPTEDTQNKDLLTRQVRSNL